MAEKKLTEILKRYEPDDRSRRLLEEAYDFSVRADKDAKMLEIKAHFPRIIDKKVIYRIEEEIRETYSLSSVRLLPIYDPSLFSYDYLPQILLETERVGIVARGFFSDYESSMNGNEILIRIPFSPGGVAFVCDAKTPRIIENIIKSEFGLIYHVTLDNSANYMDYVNPAEERLREYEMRYAAREARISSGAMGSENTNYSEEEQVVMSKVDTLYSGIKAAPRIDGNTVNIGHSTFDISEPEVIWGEPFEIKPIGTGQLKSPMGRAVIVGEIFSYSSETARNSQDHYDVIFGVFDGYSSIDVYKCNVPEEENKKMGKTFGKGTVVAISGRVASGQGLPFMGYKVKDKPVSDMVIELESAAKVKKIKRTDNAERKRVELHMHTNMSQMDAITPAADAIKLAHSWGHSAVAITDHGNVQAFPDAMLCSEKIGMKVLYGLEAYFVNDAKGGIGTKYDGKFTDEIVVFDIETTGLSVLSCGITEIGAVKIRDGRVIDVFNTFVDPERPIPEEVIKLTGITDEMVKGAPKAGEAIKSFFDFTGNDLLLAHNANFDTGFIRHYAAENGMKFENPYVDTVAISRFINTDIKNHKLNTLADYYHLGEFNHHRASDDAEMLANIYFAMCGKMEKFGWERFGDLDREMKGNTDPLQLPTYHQIILVKNLTGLRNLYELISSSYIKYYKRNPRIPKSELVKHREGLIIGSACEAGELFRAILDGASEDDIAEIVDFYDYLEIQPICNNRFLIAEGKAKDEEDLRNLNRKIVELGEKYGKPVCATCDAHFMNKEDEISRKILLSTLKFKDADKDVGLYFRTTEEMLEEFSYLGEEKAFEVVVENTNKIADMIEKVRPIPEGTFTPKLEGAEEELQKKCWERAKKMYGDPLPPIVSERLDKELTSIIKNGFAVLYMIAEKLVAFSESQGYLVGSRGSVGSSFVANMAGISEVNSLPPHYYCPECKHSEFFTNGEVGSGFDLPDANCPKCGAKLVGDGHNIPFETFLGFYGDKSPDIDLNFSGEVQGKVHKYTEELFGKENVFRAGTLGTLADKTAFGYIAKYLESKNLKLGISEVNHMISTLVGVKRTTGQHPGGIIVVPRENSIYEFTPIQHPADDPNSDILTTHYAFSYLHDTILKLDELGHDVPTKYKMIERFSGTNVMDVPMNDAEVYRLFESTEPLGVTSDDIGVPLGTLGLPEFGTKFIIGVLQTAKPKNFADLLQISGLTHGTGCWLGNADELIKRGICNISNVIGCRDDIMNELIRYGLNNSDAFKIMESVRKGKGLTPEWEANMTEHGVPDWYIESCKKIKYMFPKAHAAAYVMSAIRLAWYKVHMPIMFYCAMFTAAGGEVDAEIVMGGRRKVKMVIDEIERKGRDATAKEKGQVSTLMLVNECLARGVKILGVNINKSEAKAFKPEDGAIRLPFISLPGLGESAALAIVAEREKDPFFSVEDMQIRAKVSQSLIDLLRKNNAFDGVAETAQLTFF
ncbi:MAG: PolC-type DNA polymerase III [Clostridia bacterium]|nr:PolC-type DNA polymerase III [Clostridia bacterium]